MEQRHIIVIFTTVILLLSDTKEMVALRVYHSVYPPVPQLPLQRRAFVPWESSDQDAVVKINKQLLMASNTYNTAIDIARKGNGVVKTYQQESYIQPSVPVVSRDSTTIHEERLREINDLKANACSILKCFPKEITGAICATNFLTGHSVTFQDPCDMKKHNCIFDTDFRIILNDVCPWQFEASTSRSGEDPALSYESDSYFNS